MILLFLFKKKRFLIIDWLLIQSILILNSSLLFPIFFKHQKNDLDKDLNYLNETQKADANVEAHGSYIFI
mgnify:CR=1 FL=1